ncbi:hypothetical protein ACLKA7_011018 [Drosophila subpalustris]
MAPVPAKAKVKMGIPFEPSLGRQIMLRFIHVFVTKCVICIDIYESRNLFTTITFNCCQRQRQDGSSVKAYRIKKYYVDKQLLLP